MVERKRMNLTIRVVLHKRLKARAALSGTSMTHLLERAIERELSESKRSGGKK
jgi:predicted HicB family RNase H-like nuclease